MDRLQTQYQRLYLPPNPDAAGAQGLIGEDGQVRALVFALRGPADWDALAPVWRGVQADLALPAPAIAVNGVDAFELWFSLAEPVPLAEASAFLQGLRLHYLPETKPARLPLWPGPDATTTPPQPHTARIPAQNPDNGQWSAFVAPDLPAVFGDDPSLDFQPGEDAQAELLGRLASVSSTEWQAALARLEAAVPVTPAVSAPAAAPLPAASPVHSALNGPYPDPRRFLLDVMNDPTVALSLRIDAAKALLASGGSAV